MKSRKFLKTCRNLYRHTMLVSAGILTIGLSVSMASARLALPQPIHAADQATSLYADRVVARGYQTLFGRAPDAAEQRYWYGQVIYHPDAMWFVMTLMASAEYRDSVGKLDDYRFIDQMYYNTHSRYPTSAERTWWRTAFAGGSANRVSLTAWLIENAYSFKLTKPVREVACADFNRGGSRQPVCKPGTPGGAADVIVTPIAGTNIVVNKAFAPQVKALVDEGRRYGIDLQAHSALGSYRSYADQVALRRQNCGTSTYAIYQMPPSSCRIPTAIPDTSLHNWGLAIDFRCNGQAINTRSHWCHQWLMQHAPAHGIYNYPPEPWHFSSTGR